LINLKRGKMEMDGMCAEIRLKAPFYSGTPGSRTVARNNDIKTVWKSKSREKTDSPKGNEDTTDRGHYHRQTVVSFISIFLYSFFLPRAQ